MLWPVRLYLDFVRAVAGLAAESVADALLGKVDLDAYRSTTGWDDRPR